MSTAVDIVLSLALILFGGGAAVRYVLERRTARASGRVAESTAELQIDAVQLQNIRTQMDLMKAAWAAERASMQGRMSNLAQELAEERADSRRKDVELRDLRVQVDRMQRELATLGSRLAELTNDKPNEN